MLDALDQAGLDIHHRGGEGRRPSGAEFRDLLRREPDQVGVPAAGPGADLAGERRLRQHQPPASGRLAEVVDGGAGVPPGQVDDTLAGGPDPGDDAGLERLPGGVEQGVSGSGPDAPPRLQLPGLLGVQDVVQQPVAAPEPDVLGESSGADAPSRGRCGLLRR